jgi:hypothetical protein
VLHQSKMRPPFDPTARETLAASTGAIASASSRNADNKIEKIRRG